MLSVFQPYIGIPIDMFLKILGNSTRPPWPGPGHGVKVRGTAGCLAQLETSELRVVSENWRKAHVTIGYDYMQRTI